MTIRGYIFIGLLIGCASFLPGTAWADVVPITNASFEVLPAGGLNLGCGTGCSYNVGSIPGWTITSSGADEGEFRPGPPSNLAYFYSVPDGVTVAYSNGGIISQTVEETVQVGQVYTLSVDLGNRLDGYQNHGSADLLINGIRYAATGTEAAPGYWTLWTTRYVGLGADVGQSITIELNANGAQGDYDNVILRTPEPTAILLMGVMGGVLLALAGALKLKSA